MDDESLKIASEIIVDALFNTNEINNIDKVELALNIKLFLKENEYRENIKVLSRRNNKWKNK